MKKTKLDFTLEKMGGGGYNLSKPCIYRAKGGCCQLEKQSLKARKESEVNAI